MRYFLASLLLIGCGILATAADSRAFALPTQERSATSIAARSGAAERAADRPEQLLPRDQPSGNDLDFEEDVQPKPDGAVGPRTGAALPSSDPAFGYRVVLRAVVWTGRSTPPRGPPSPFAS